MRMKKLLCMILMISIAASIYAVPVRAEKVGVQLGIFPGKSFIEVKRNGLTSAVELETAPVCVNGTTYIPLYGILQQLGVLVSWDAKKQLVTITRDPNRESLIKLGIGAATAAINGTKIVKLPAPGKMINGKPMLPLKFVLENIGCYDVNWDSKQNKVTVTEFIVYNFTYVDYWSERVCQKTYNDFVYYINTSGKKLYKRDVDGKNEVLLRDIECEAIWGANDDGVYITKKADHALYRISNDGSREDLIVKANRIFKVIQVDQHHIYYTKLRSDDSYIEKNCLYATDTRFMATQRAMDDEITGSAIINNDICYFYNSIDTKLYKVDLNSKAKTELCSDAIGEMKLDGSWLYYNNLLDYGALYRINVDGSNRQRLSPDFSIGVIADGDYVYYLNACDGKKVYRVPKTGGKSSLASRKDMDREVALELAGLSKLQNTIGFGGYGNDIVGDWIYFIVFEDNYRLYKAKTDGSRLTRLTNGQASRVSTKDGTIYYVETLPDNSRRNIFIR